MNPTNIDSIGKVIKNQRKRKGLSQIALASKANISASYLCDIEKCRTVPSIITLQKIAKALEVNDFNIFLNNNYVNSEIGYSVS